MKVMFSALELGLSLLPVVGISLAPETYNEGGGGLLDDVDVQFLALKFITSEGTPYDKGDKKLFPLLQVDMLPEGTQEVHTQYFSCGSLDRFAPSANGETLDTIRDGKRLTSEEAKDQPGISKSCNAAIFLTSLVQAGVPGTKLASDKISDLVGIKCHVVRTKRDKVRGAKESDRDPQVLTVSRLISTPWGGAHNAASSPAVTTAKEVAASTPAQTYQPVSSNGSFGDAELGILAMQVLQNHGGSLKKMQLMQEVYKAAVGGAVPADAKDGDGKLARTTLPQKVMNDAFLASQPYWRYDGSTVTLIG